MAETIPKAFESIKTFALGNDSEVFLVKRKDDGQQFLFKTLKQRDPGASGKTIDLKLRFKNEVDVAATLNHPNIAKIHSSFSREGTFSLLYPYKEGQTLAKMLEEGNPIPHSTALTLVSQLLSALDYIHSKGIVHCDINPNNIYISKENHLEVFDFGLSLVERRYRAPGSLFLGTIPYLAPEQTGYTDFEIDHRTDLFCAALILYRLFSGKLPFKSKEDLKAYMGELLQTEPEPVQDLSMGFNQILFKSLEPNPEERYQTAEGFRHDLQLAQASGESGGSPLTLGNKDRILAATRKKFFIGRENQVHSLHEGLRAMKAGKGSAYLIYGISGIGKTEIVREFTRGLPPEVLAINIKCNQFSPSQPFSVVRTAILETLAHINNTGDAEEMRRVLSRSLAEHSGVLCKNVEELQPFFEEIKEDVAVEREQDRVIHVLHLLLQELARKYTMVLYVDDIQWMDKTSYDVLKKCLNDHLNFQLIFNFRTQKAQEEPYLHSQPLLKLKLRKVMSIQPFSHREIKAFIRQSFETVENEDGLVRTLALKTDNTPFSLSEALRLLVRENVITYGAGAWSFDAGGWISRVNRLDPATLIQRKFELANEGEQAYVKLASLFGGKFDPGVLLELSGLPEERAARYLDSLEHRGFVAAGFQGKYQFTHDQVHEVISRSIPKEESRARHEKIGDLFLEKSKKKRRAILSAAEHYLKSANAYKSMETCVTAARYAKEKMDHDLAMRYYHLCLLLEQANKSEYIPESYDRVRTRLDLADLYILKGKNEEALKLVSLVVNEKVDSQTLVRAYYTMGLAHSNLADMERAVEYYGLGLKVLKYSIPQNRGQIVLSLILNLIKMFFDFPIKKTNKSSAKHDRLFLSLKLLNRLSFSYFFTDLSLCVLTQIKALNLAKRLPTSEEKIKAFTMHTVPAYQFFLKGRAFKYAKRSHDLAQKTNKSDIIAFTNCFSGIINYFDARWTQATKKFIASMEMYDSIGDAWGTLLPTEHIWLNLLHRGEFKNAKLYLNKSIEKSTHCPDKHYFFVTKLADTFVNTICTKNVNVDRLLELHNDIIKNESILTKLQSYAYVARTLLSIGKLDRAFHLLVEGTKLCVSKKMTQEYITPLFVYLCETCTEEKIKRIDNNHSVRVSNKTLDLEAKKSLKNLAFLSLIFPAYRGVTFKFLAWNSYFKKRKYIADKLFRLSIRHHKRLDMKFQEALSRKSYAQFLEISFKPGIARDEFQKAFDLFKSCEAALECEKIKDKVILPETETADPRQTRESNAFLSGETYAAGAGKLRLDSLSSISRSITSESDLSQLLNEVLRTAIEVTQAQKGYLFLMENEYLDSSNLFLNYQGEALDHQEVNFSQEILEWVQSEQKIFRLTSMENCPVKIETPEKIKSVLCLPLEHNQNLLGMIYLSHDRIKGMFGEESEKAAGVISTQASILLENAQHIQRYRDLNRSLEKKVLHQTKSIREKNEHLEDARLRLVESERMRNLLAGTLVHDIKNYLTGVEGNLRILTRKYKDDPKGLRNIQAATEACQDILSMTSNLLDVGKMEEGRLELKTQKIQLTEVVELVKKVQRTHETGESKLQFGVEVSKGNEAVYWDPALLQRVLQNLLHNANKYTPKGGEIQVRLDPKEKETVLSVYNSGTPLEEVLRATVFEKYSRVDGKWSQYSKGMGLYFCKMVVEAHGGSIWMDTDPTGNYFRFSLPNREAPSPKEQHTQKNKK